MKKTLLATAIAGALGASVAAQAATIYSQDGTEVDVYGRIVFGYQTGGTDSTNAAGVNVRESGSSVEDYGSRLGFRARHEINSDLSVFANMEFRFEASQRNNSNLDDNRNTFVGIQSNQFGRLWAGNFNSIYYNALTSHFDVPENAGWVSIGGTDNSSHGDALAYSTPVLEGFQAHMQVKHYSGNDRAFGPGSDAVDADGDPIYNNADDSSGSTTSSQVAISYTWQDLYLAVGYDQNRDYGNRQSVNRGDGFGSSLNNSGRHSGEEIWGFLATYQFTPAFSARLGYETTSSNDSELEATGGSAQYLGRDIASIGATYDYGLGEIYGQYSRVSWDDTDATGDISSANQWMLGANYRFSQPMYVFAEVYDADFDSDQQFSEFNDDLLYTIGVRYDF